MREQKDLEWFIDTVLLGDLRRMVYDSNLHYLSFIPIACGIEFLGACRDSQPFNQPNLARQRFESAIVMLFPPEYHHMANAISRYDLYSQLFVSMTQTLKPGGLLDLSTVAESVREGTSHLKPKANSEQIVLLVEILYKDLAEACREVKADMRSGRYLKQLSDLYLGVDE